MTNAPAGNFRGVASSIQGPHSPPAGFPAPPLCQPKPAAAASRTGLPEAKPRQQIRSPGAAAAMAACNLHHPVISLGPGLAVDDDGGGRGEGGNQLFRKTRSERGEGEKEKGSI